MMIVSVDVIIFISGLPFPENVRAVEEECGRVNVSWEVRVQIVVRQWFSPYVREVT